MKFASKPKTFIILCLISIVAGCSAKQIALEDPAASSAAEVIVSGITYDDKGLPVMGAFLAKRPSRPGDHFSVIRFTDDMPVISYDIVVKRQKPDFAKPLHVIYGWTGKGFILGADITVVMLQGMQVPQDKHAAELEFAIIITPLAVCTAGGFVVGLADGIRQTALELNKVVANGEVAVTCTTYEYDALNRLSYMRMLTPDRKQVLVLTQFEYKGAETIPFRTVVKSLAEGKEREVR